MNEFQLLRNSSEDLRWFISNLSQLRNEYSDAIVAIRNKEIIANAKNIQDLMLELRKIRAKKEEVLIKQIPSKKEIIIFGI